MKGAEVWVWGPSTYMEAHSVCDSQRAWLPVWHPEALVMHIVYIFICKWHIQKIKIKKSLKQRKTKKNKRYANKRGTFWELQFRGAGKG